VVYVIAGRGRKEIRLFSYLDKKIECREGGFD